MKTTICFGKKYDVDRLAIDLRAAEDAGHRHLHWSKDHDGGWSAIPLVSIDGCMDADSLRFRPGAFKKTPILSHCPYFEEIVDSFKCVQKRIRLMRLEPGTNILRHTDPGDAWALGEVRFHIPIVTHDDVQFFVDGERLKMLPGELWFCDFSRPHWVHNRSPIARVHLVLDLSVNQWLRSMFPSESFAEQVSNRVYCAHYYSALAFRNAVSVMRLGKIRRLLFSPTSPA